MPRIVDAAAISATKLSRSTRSGSNSNVVATRSAIACRKACPMSSGGSPGKSSPTEIGIVGPTKP